LPGNWRERSLARYEQLYREGQCVHFACRSDQNVIALAGALFIDETPFLSTRVIRYALMIDEYISPPFRGQGLEGRLRDALLTKIAEQGAILHATLPLSAARLAAGVAGNLRL
jgi:GNAT superfamily N-acetyltransferase